MPLYEYVCPDCGHRFVRLQPMSAPKEGEECPVCAHRNGHRVMSSFSSKGGETRGAASCGPAGSPFR